MQHPYFDYKKITQDKYVGTVPSVNLGFVLKAGMDKLIILNKEVLFLFEIFSQKYFTVTTRI